MKKKNMKQKTKRRKRKQLVNVMRADSKRCPLMSSFAATTQGFGHSRGK